MQRMHKITPNKQSVINSREYLRLEGEPREQTAQIIPADIEEELLANRYFLKKRVWKNIEKMHRSNYAQTDDFEYQSKKLFKAHHLPV